DPYFDRTIKIYQLALKKGERSPFEPPDELHPDKPDEAAKPGEPPKPGETPRPGETAKPGDAAKPADATKSGDAGKSPQPPPKVDIDLDGIITRLQEVPAPPGNYTNLAVAGKRLCWIARDPESPEKNALQCLDIQNKGDKPETLMEGVTRFEVSGDGKKMLVAKRNDFFVLDASVREAALKDPKTLAEAHVDLKDWTFSVVPADEFREAFLDAWRLHRDYFYDPHMHGVDWSAMRGRYLELVGRVHDRQELNDVIAQMVSELSMLHTFVSGGGGRGGADKIQLASLGARLAREASGYTVEHIYKTDPDRPDKVGPLGRPGVDIGEGDVILAINGRELSGVDPGELLRNQAGKQVLLRVRPRGKTETRDVIAKPV